MKKVVLLLIAPFFMYSQSETDIINPKGKWYFGAEIGLNQITSYSFDEGRYSASCGAIAEYYFAKHWSIQAKVKYMKTGVSYLKKTVYGWDWDWGWKNSSPLQDTDYPLYNRFDAHTIVIPIDLKWEFRLFKNLNGNLRVGTAFNIETQSTYHYNVNDSKGSSTFVSANFGYGLNYYFSEAYSFGIDLETFSIGGIKGRTSDGSNSNQTKYATNAVYSLQIKYHF